jgi:hypothetical protein
MKFIHSTLIFLACSASMAGAADIAIGLGAIDRPSDGGALLRIEGRTPMPDEWLTSVSDNLHGYWQANGNAWHNDGSGHFAVGAGVGAQYHFNERWKIELAWGGVLLNDRYIAAEHNLGSNFNFETSIGVQYHWQDNHSLRLNVYHWSNAGLANQNPGCEIIIAAYQFKF